MHLRSEEVAAAFSAAMIQSQTSTIHWGPPRALDQASFRNMASLKFCGERREGEGWTGEIAVMGEWRVDRKRRLKGV